MPIAKTKVDSISCEYSWILWFFGSDRISVQEEGLRRSQSLLWFVGIQNRSAVLVPCSERHQRTARDSTVNHGTRRTRVISGAKSGFKLHKLWIGQLGVNSSARALGTGYFMDFHGISTNLWMMWAMWPDGDGQLVIYLWYSTSLCLQYVSCRYCTCICSMWIYHPQHVFFLSLHLESWALPRLRWLNQRRPRWSFAQTSQMHSNAQMHNHYVHITYITVKIKYIGQYTVWSVRICIYTYR